jgi:hypothetical protein
LVEVIALELTGLAATKVPLPNDRARQLLELRGAVLSVQREPSPKRGLDSSVVAVSSVSFFWVQEMKAANSRTPAKLRIAFFELK